MATVPSRYYNAVISINFEEWETRWSYWIDMLITCELELSLPRTINYYTGQVYVDQKWQL
jgi:hypothetical protein